MGNVINKEMLPGRASWSGGGGWGGTGEQDLEGKEAKPGLGIRQRLASPARALPFKGKWLRWQLRKERVWKLLGAEFAEAVTCMLQALWGQI